MIHGFLVRLSYNPPLLVASIDSIVPLALVILPISQLWIKHGEPRESLYRKLVISQPREICWDLAHSQELTSLETRWELPDSWGNESATGTGIDHKSFSSDP